MQRLWIVVLAIVIVGAAIYAVWPRSPTASTLDAAPPAISAKIEPAIVATALPPPEKEEGRRSVPFGPQGLGRVEGKRIAPASFLAEPDGMWILDQENARIVKPDGSVFPNISKYADDIARGSDGSIAVLDRTHDKEVTILDASGRVRGKIPIAGPGIDDPKDVSRLFVSGNDVLVERNGGGPLLRLGGIDGTPAKERPEIQGIPTRDGSGLVSAGITNEDDGRAWVTFADTNAVHRWTRELKFPSVLSAVAFLDTDKNGTIWSVLLAGSSPADYVNWAVCMDPKNGALRKSFTLRPEDPPWESFRDFAVQDGVGLIVATRSESGVDYATYRCP